MNALPTSSYLMLGLAILAEVIGTSALKASDGFTRLAPSAITVVAYAVSFYLLSLALRTMPIGIAYAIWSGVGIVLISAVGWLHYGQRLDLPAVIGLGLIVAGVLVVNLFSKTTGH
jgi:small multidrug resistance pump